MTDITELAQRMSIERIKQIALGGTPTMGEKESLAITALYFSEELKIATDAFQAAGLAQLAAEEALEKAQEDGNEYAASERAVVVKNVELQDEIYGLKTRIAELEHFRTACMEWSDKTDWVQTDKRFEALKPWGKHRADILKAYIEHLESRTVTAAAADVLAERQRQVTAEGWTPGHDDEYEHGELADAAGCYALSSDLFDCAGEPPRPWPWPDEWWKPTSRRRDLVKAGALILAEIERIDRAGSGRKGKNQPGMVVAVHIDAGDFVKFRDQVYEVKETDFDDHDVTLWFVGGEALQCAAGCQIEVVSAPGETE
ncbi:TPA: hypothetical protein ACGQVP_001654 [Raoultella planticola]